MADDRIQLNLVLNEASVSSVEGRVRNIVNNLNNHPISLNIDGRNINNIINNLNTIYQQMQRLNNSSVNINANLTTQQQQYRLETERMRVAQQISVERERTLQSENRAIRALAEENRTMTINRNLTSDINGNIRHTHEHIRNVNNATNDFATGLGRSLQYILQYKVITEMLNQITEAYRELKAVDSSMVGYRKVTGASKAEVKSLTKEAFANASEYSRLASEYAESTERFAKAGYNDKSSELSELALLAENVGDIDNALANEFIVSSDAAWKLNGDITELTKILDMFNELSNKTATDVSKLASGITVSGSMFAQAKLSAQDYAAIIGTATSKTQRSGEEMSRAWRTIIMNLSQIKGTDIETGEIIDEDKLAKAEKTLNAVGIQIREIVNGQNELRNPMNVLKEIADKWHSLSSIQQSALAESISNKRQSNAFISVIESWQDVEKAIEITSESSNSAMRENEIYMDSWAAKQKKVSAEWSEFISHMSNVKIIKGTLDSLVSAINVIDTPLGRIVAQIVLINTALAVSNRLWGAVRSRSIVADILSMGLAEGSLGTAIQLVTEHLWEQATAWLATPMGMATVASAGIFLLTSSISKYNKKLEEARQATIELGKETAQTNKELDTLVAQYRKLGEDGKLDNSDREQAYDIQKQINELLEDEVGYINLANGEYEEQLKLLRDIQHRQAKDSVADIKDAKTAAEKSLLTKASYDIDNGMSDVFGGVKAERKALENLLKDEGLEKYLGKGLGEDKGYRFFKIDRRSNDTILKSYEDMVKLRNILADSYDEEIKEGGDLEDFYNNLKDKIDGMTDAVQTYKDAMANYNINQAVIKFNEEEFSGVTGAMINSEAAMSKWIDGLLSSGKVSSELKREMISLAKTNFPQYIAQINKATESQAKLSIRSKLHDKSISGNITALKNQATALGITEQAMIDLVVSEIKFSRNELNISQKVTALKEVAVWAGVAQKSIDGIMNSTNKKNWAATNNFDILGVGKEGEHWEYNGEKYYSWAYRDKNTGIVYDKIEQGKEVRLDEAIQNQIDKFNDVQVSENPYTPSESSSSSSKSNEALDNYLHEAERRYKVHQNELQYISDLQYAYDNLTKSQEERLDILDDIDEAYKNHAENQIKDIEHQMELLKNLYGEDNVDLTPYYEQMQKIRETEANRLRAAGYDNNSNEVQEQQIGWWKDEDNKVQDFVKQHEKTIRNLEHSMKLELEANPFADTTEFYKAMQDEYHAMAERYRALDPEKYAKEIQELQEKWHDAQDNILDWKLNNSQNWIDERNRLGDWELFGDSEVKAWERVVKWLKEDYPNDLDKIKEAEASLFEARKKQINETLNHQMTQLDSLKALTEGYYNVINSIAEAQNEINKELKASQALYEYLDKDARKLLFNQDDYNILNRELLGIQEEAKRLQARYNRDILKATENNVAEITSKYEMQYKVLMKNYEITKAELDVAKKRQQLDNVLNERNVKMFINGQWQRVANTDDVINAQNELADAKYAKTQAENGLAQETELNNIQAAQDKLTTAINGVESGVVDFNEEVVGITSGLGLISSYDVPALSSICNNATKAIKQFAEDLTEKKISSGVSGNGSIKLNGAYKYSPLWSSGLNAKINQYASGTPSTKEGFALMGEAGDELFINAAGHVIPLTKPTLAKVSAGNTIFNQEQLDNIGALQDISSRMKFKLNNSMHFPVQQPSGDTNCNNITIENIRVTGGNPITDDLVNAATRYAYTCKNKW